MKRGGRGERRRRNNMWSTAIPYIVYWCSEAQGLLLPSMCRYGVCLHHDCAAQHLSVSSYPPPPCPYFGMLMCYLFTMCMNDNMSVYNKQYPIRWCWWRFECCIDLDLLCPHPYPSLVPNFTNCLGCSRLAAQICLQYVWLHLHVEGDWGSWLNGTPIHYIPVGTWTW